MEINVTRQCNHSLKTVVRMAAALLALSLTNAASAQCGSGGQMPSGGGGGGRVATGGTVVGNGLTASTGLAMAQLQQMAAINQQRMRVQQQQRMAVLQQQQAFFRQRQAMLQPAASSRPPRPNRHVESAQNRRAAYLRTRQDL